MGWHLDYPSGFARAMTHSLGKKLENGSLLRHGNSDRNNHKHNHPTPSFVTVPMPALRPVKGPQRGPERKQREARGSLDGPPQAPVTLPVTSERLLPYQICYGRASELPMLVGGCSDEIYFRQN